MIRRKLSYKRRLAQETLILDVTEEICTVMEEQGISKSELARLLKKSKGFVSQILSGERNMTLRTVADIANVLGYEFEVKLKVMVE
jgi:transcriptional regulator with XRE-family HTH domain